MATGSKGKQALKRRLPPFCPVIIFAAFDIDRKTIYYNKEE